MKAPALAFVVVASISLARIPPQSEVTLTKAVVAFQDGNLIGANSQIAELLKLHPQEPQVLEMKAMIQKSMGNLGQSKETYLRLFQKARKNRNRKKGSAYAFEIGNLYYGERELSTAHKYLKIAAKANFNSGAAELLLGKIDLERGKFPESRTHFEVASLVEAFRAPAKLLIAQSYEQQNLAADAVGAYVDTKEALLEESEQGKDQVRRTLATSEKILNNVNAELSTYSRSQWTRAIGISTGYDSNVLFMPNSTDANNISTTGSVKQTFQWGLRYVSDPTEKWQYGGAYQGSINYNFNQTTQAGQFFTQDFSTSVIRGALKSTHYGIRLTGTGVFQYQTNAYKPFSLSGSAGPFMKIKMNEFWAIGFDSSFQPSRNFLDPNLDGAVRRSGWEQMIRAYMASRQNNPYWTPSLFLTGTLLRPEGKEFSGTRINLDFNNGMYLSNNWFVAQTLGLSVARYPNRTLNERNDQGFTAGVSGGYQVSESLVLMGQIDYGQNFSSDSNFRYNRWATTVSGNYLF